MVLGIPGYIIKGNKKSMRLDLTAISKLDFAMQVTIEIYHCYAAKKFACNDRGELIQENNSPRSPKENEKCSSVVEELVYLLKRKCVCYRLWKYTRCQ